MTVVQKEICMIFSFYECTSERQMCVSLCVATSFLPHKTRHGWLLYCALCKRNLKILLISYQYKKSPKNLRRRRRDSVDHKIIFSSAMTGSIGMNTKRFLSGLRSDGLLGKGAGFILLKAFTRRHLGSNPAWEA